MPWDAVASVVADWTMADTAAAVTTTAGVNSLTGGGVTNALGLGGSVQQATQAADPMAPYRANMAAMYSGALQPGAKTDITQMPGYSQFKSGVMDPALEASKRSSAASGMMRSGNEQIALEKTAQQGYSGFMTDYMNRLASGAGVAQSPAAGAAAGVAQQGNIQQGLTAVSTGLSGLFGSAGSNPGYTVDTSGYGMGSGGMGTVDTAALPAGSFR